MNSLSATVEPSKRPSFMLLGLEPWRAAWEFAAHKLAPNRTVARGDGRPVVIFPGMASNSRAVAPLREYCESIGYIALDWGRGFNTGPRGDVDAWLAELAHETQARLAQFDAKATLIGWSLGGLYARELAKLMPAQVGQVITIGTPFNAEADHTNVGWLYQLLNGHRAAPDGALSGRLRRAPHVPTTSIYSRSDGVVAWQTCTHDAPSARAQDIEVRSSHLGMGWNRAVLRVVGECLARPPGHRGDAPTASGMQPQ